MLEWSMAFLRAGELPLFVFGALFHFFNLDSLSKWIRKYYPLLFGVLVSAVIKYSGCGAVAGLSLQSLVLLWLLALNYKQAGLNLVIAGSLMNFLVMIVNGGAMPITEESLEGLEHKFINSGTKLVFLSDVILIGNYFLSPGDIVHRVGLLIFFLHQAILLFKIKLKSF